MKMPKGITKKQKMHLRKIYESNYNKNFPKLGEKKAKNVARAKFYEEAFKMFMKQEELLEEKPKIIKKKTYIKENLDYKAYEYNNTKLIVSTDEKLLNKFKNAERKGLLRDMDDPYEQEVLFKIKDEYNIEFSPDMYYVIK